MRLVANHGAGFGLGSGHETLVEMGEAASLVVLAAVARRQPRLVAVGLGAALGGGLGNLAVRLLGPDGPLGSPVLDWIHVAFYPYTFNFADLSIRTGLLVAATAVVYGPLRQCFRGHGARRQTQQRRGPHHVPPT